MIALTARQIAHIVDGAVTGDAGRRFVALSSDSRSIRAGDLFVALAGERHDGHDFVLDVCARGAERAGGAIVARAQLERLAGARHDAALIAVDDTQRALTALGYALRNLHPGRFVAVTGSVGKTTAKDMIAAALSAFGKVGRTPGNYNNHIGVPLTLAGLDGDEDFVVMELGMSAAGEIARLTHLVRPDVALVTRAAAAHLEFFRDVDAIADAKAELYEHLPPRALAVVNADDARMSERAEHLVASERVVTFGHDLGAHVRVLDAVQTSGELVATLGFQDDAFEARLSAFGLHNADNAAAALAVVRALDLPLAQAVLALEAGFRSAKHRLQKVALGELTVLDDSYNANPASTRAALDTFAALAAATPIADRLAVIGSMRELGPDADTHHAEIGALAAGIAQLVVATGPHADPLARAARDAGATVLAAPDVADVATALRDWARSHPRGAILLKGSRGERLERVLDLLPHAGGR